MLHILFLKHTIKIEKLSSCKTDLKKQYTAKVDLRNKKTSRVKWKENDTKKRRFYSPRT